MKCALTTSEKACLAGPQTDRALVLADGTVLEGFGLGAEGHAVGEVCFNTAMTAMRRSSPIRLCGQLITFTFPHIGNVGNQRRRSSRR
jgi:carbamoyl-phosphate synthase small subunit